MKFTIVICLSLLMCTNLLAQDSTGRDNREPINTLIGQNTRLGAYITFENQFVNYNSEIPAVYFGSRVGFVFNRSLFIGVGAYGLTSDVLRRDLLGDGRVYEFESAYGGLSVEPILFGKQAVHVSFPLFAGIGGAYYHERGRWDFGPDEDAFWIYQAGANLELNVTRWMRLSGGIYYTETQNLDLVNTPQSFMEGFHYGGSIKFGAF